jgi:hypothetical protein
MIIEITMYYILFVAAILIIISIVIGNKRTKANNRTIYKMDKVITRTGGLAHDRIYENIEKEDIIMDEMENNKR